MGKGLPRSMARGAALRQEILNLTIPLKDLSITVTSVTSGKGAGTAVISGLPQGNLLLLGAVSYVQLETADADIGATFDGDYGIGTIPNANTDLTDAGDDDIIPSTALGAATAKLSPMVRGVSTEATEHGAILDNTGGTLELNLNVLIDAADIADDSSAVFTANGVLHVALIPLGDD